MKWNYRCKRISVNVQLNECVFQVVFASLYRSTHVVAPSEIYGDSPGYSAGQFRDLRSAPRISPCQFLGFYSLISLHQVTRPIRPKYLIRTWALELCRSSTWWAYRAYWAGLVFLQVDSWRTTQLQHLPQPIEWVGEPDERTYRSDKIAKIFSMRW